MPVKTLTEMRKRAGRLADMEDDGNFIPTDERTDYINDGIAALYDVRVDADGGKLMAINGPQLQSLGDYAWQLPNNFARLVSLHIYSGGRYYPVRPADMSEYAELAANPPDERYARYFLRFGFGTNVKEIYLFPLGISAEHIAYTYLPVAPQLSLDTDIFSGTLQEIEYVETYAAIKMLRKEESDTSALEFQREQLKTKIRNATKDVDLNAPRRVRKLRGRYTP